LKKLNLKELNFLDVLDGDQVKPYLPRLKSGFYSKGDYTNSKYMVTTEINWSSFNKNSPPPDVPFFEESIRAYEIKRDPSRYVLFLDYFMLNELLDIFDDGMISREDHVYIPAVSEYALQDDEKRLKNWLDFFKIKYETRVHASGHASRGDLFKMMRAMKPKLIFPIHTPYPEKFNTGEFSVVDEIEKGKQYDI
ncbi:MAG: MBL fold metallo-hydrolase RNA specificity domain-containing protein, partial [Candidatus Helarchaeales archaeon]